MELLRENLPSDFYGPRAMTRAYDAFGRPTGMPLVRAADPDPIVELATAYASYDLATGRLSTHPPIKLRRHLRHSPRRHEATKMDR